MKTIDRINNITQELVDPKFKLSDIMLKMQVLSFQLKNEKLKQWVDAEINGYVGKEVPKYRIIPTSPFGNLIQERGFGGYAYRNNMALPIDYLDEEIVDSLLKRKMISSVSELENMAIQGGDFQTNIPYPILKQISKNLTNNWHVDSGWLRIPRNSIEGILHSIKSSVLKFLLELAEEIGEQENINFMDKKRNIDGLFDKTIGSITGENVHVSIGSDNIQSVNSGDNANMNIAKGDSINQNISSETMGQLKDLINSLKLNLEEFQLKNEDKQDILNEIARVETQLQRETPKYPIIKGALSIMGSLLLGVTGNAITEPILHQLGILVANFK